ncbi:haloacid dehalogenase-like hydrolase [Streptomyces sp. NPDC048484]|uniref:HAD family hydrolase n=1 Tax=Streptomyces sp. NPDC048484 TaxID=3155146 RepID=UPI00343EC111
MDGTPAPGRFAVLDLDGTLHPGTLGLKLLAALADHGICDSEQASRLADFLGSLPPHQLHTGAASQRAYQLYAQAVAGARPEAVHHVATQVWKRERAGLFAFVRPALTLLRNRSYTVVLLSGSPQEIVRAAVTDLGITVCQGAEFETDGTVYNGRIGAAPGMPGAKATILHSVLHAAWSPADSIAIGNSAADIEVLAQVGHPIAFEPQPPLRQAAALHGWRVTDRDSLLPVLLADTETHGDST